MNFAFRKPGKMLLNTFGCQYETFHGKDWNQGQN